MRSWRGGEHAPTPLAATSASCLIQRPGRWTNAGLITVTVEPTSAGAMTLTRPMSWNRGSQVTPREDLDRPSPSKSWMTLVTTLRCVISTPAGTRVEPEVYCR